ncbi:MAG: hypothetical protein AB7N90_10545, partial [Vicinamibacterales bacterium]
MRPSPPPRRRHAAALAAALLVLGLPSRAAAPVFFDDDPIWTEPVSQDASAVTRYEPDLVYQTLEGLVGALDVPESPGRARNINTVDEVPDGPFYVNRAGRLPLTPARVAQAANTSDGPAPGPWTVVSAKSDGITPGFTIRDRANTLWFIKFDPPGWRGMATGSEVVAAKLFWAVGYHTVEYHIGRLVPSNLVIGPGATVTPAGEAERVMVPADVDRLLSRADRDDDGSFRVILSRAAPGRPVGRIRFSGTRADDPNDIVPHEDRRELRGYRVFAAWLNHVDAKGINSLAALVTEDGRSFVRRYLLDFGSALGSAAIGPREGWEGSEALVEDPGEIGRRILSFGFRIPAWRTEDWYVSPAVGRLPRSHDGWDPGAWQPHIMNAAFNSMRADDAFWAASKLAAVSDEMVAAAVAEGRFGDAGAEAVLSRFIRERRDRILRAYLPAVNPIVDPALDAGGLRFANAAVAAGVAPAPGGYHARWSRFDNLTGEATLIAETGGAGSPIE